MTFDRTWVLLLLIVPVAWVVWEWRGESRRTALLLKAAAIMAILLAIAEPKVTFFDTKVAVAILADTSRSLSAQDLERASALAAQIESARGRNLTKVIPFSRSTRNPLPQERQNGGWKLQYTGGDAGRGTNLEAAIREGIGSLPSGMVRRVVLISDGNENLGSAARAAWQAQQLAIPIDTLVLAGSPRPELRVESVSLPSLVLL